MGLEFLQLLQGDQPAKAVAETSDLARQDDHWIRVLGELKELPEGRDRWAGFAAGMLIATGSNRIRDAAALALVDLEARDAAGSLIEVLFRPEVARHSGTLLFALNELQASIPLSLLVHVIANGSYEGRSMALWFVNDDRVSSGTASEVADAQQKLAQIADRDDDPEAAEAAQNVLAFLAAAQQPSDTAVGG